MYDRPSRSLSVGRRWGGWSKSSRCPGKKTLVAAERNEEHRYAFRRRVARFAHERLIFVDETGIHTAMTRRYARAPRGQRAVGTVPRNHGRTVSVIGALGVTGMVAAMRVEGAVDTDVFNSFVRQGLAPKLRPGAVVLLDNLSVHHASVIEAVVRARQGQVVFLPPYSPDFSPLENCWAKVKTALRAAAARIRHTLARALTTALRRITPQDIRGWFRHCGYPVAPE